MKLYFAPIHALLLLWYTLCLSAELFFSASLAIAYGALVLQQNHERSKANGPSK